MAKFEIIARAYVDQLGEGPTWSAETGRLYWVDIVGQALNALELANGVINTWPMPEKIGWVAERRGCADLLAGFKGGIVSLTLDPFTATPFLVPEPDRPHNRLNDAKVDATGRLWFGSKDDRDEEATGALYRLDRDHRLTCADDGYRVTNGPAFSPDGQWLYHNDSGLGLVYRFPLHADGTLGPREVLIRFADDWGAPDGMTTDAEGCLWIAHWAGGRVSRFDPDGELIRSHALPASNITSCAFAGPDLDRLFVTSAALASPERPEDGVLFEIDPGVRGLPTNTYGG